jgi:hypothetical protein
MSSVQRAYAQRNNNVTQIVPEFVEILPVFDLSGADLSGAALYNLNIPNVQYTQGVYCVDMSARDSSGNLLNVDGLFYPFFPTGTDLQPISIINFYINIGASASAYPGLELTIYFKNLPLDRLEGSPFLTIGIMASNNEGPPIPYIVSPPFPPLFGTTASSSITLKSDGTNFNVISSGPAGWMGVPALSVILAAYNNIGL